MAPTSRDFGGGHHTPDTIASLAPEEIRAAAETYHELGPGYRDAVIESFLDRVGREVDARVDARLAYAQAALPPERSRRRGSGSPLALAIASLILGMPISAIAVGVGPHPAGAFGLVVVWIAISAINIAHAASWWARARQSQGPR